MLKAIFCVVLLLNQVSIAAKLKVVTSVAPITNMVANVGGGKIEVEGIVPEGVNSHTFEPAPSDARLLAAADLIIMNGLRLELPTIKLANEVKKNSTPIIQLGDLTLTRDEWKFDFSFPEDTGTPNPHLWPNIAYSMRYIELIRDALAEVDVENKEAYFVNAELYLMRLDKLDKAIFECVASIPENNRKLVTYHDSYAYFAPRYGMEVIGAIQPSDFSEPSPKEIARIIEQLRNEGVTAVFGSEVFPSKVLQQIAKEAGAKYVDELADDSLPGEVGEQNHTFIGMMVNNMKAITEALGGDPSCVNDVETFNLILPSTSS